MFVMAGGSKLAGAPTMVQLFDAIGLGQWFRYVTGTIEIGSAILLLIPSLASVGGLLLANDGPKTESKAPRWQADVISASQRRGFTRSCWVTASHISRGPVRRSAL